MRLRFLLIPVLMLASFLHAGELRFFTGSWSETMTKAKAEQKYVMLDCYTNWCGWCKVMDKEAFHNDSVIAEIDLHFVAARREMEKEEEGRLLALKYHVNAFPTYLFFSPEGELVYVHLGYAKPSDFMAILRKLRKKENQQQYAGISTKTNPGFPSWMTEEPDKENRKQMREKQAEQEKMTIDYLDRSSNLFGEVEFAMMWRSGSVNEKYDSWILQHADTLGKLYGSYTVEGMVQSLLRYRTRAAAQKNDEAALKETLRYCSAFGADSNYQKLSYSLLFYQATKNCSKQAELLKACADTANLKSDQLAFTLNRYAWGMYEDCEDQAALGIAAGMMKSVTDAKPEYAYLDTYAALLYKTKQYAEAEKQALKALDAGKAAGDDVSSTEGLLQNIRMKR